ILFCLLPHPPSSTLFPYTTLFRSFRRAAAISCACADCRELKRFLEDPQEQVHRFRVAEHRRKHLENSIRRGRCDLDLKTERTGRSEEHTSELQSLAYLVCRLLLEK